MSRIQKALHNDIHALEMLRDELRLQAHLFRTDAHTRWQDLENRWNELKEHLKRAQVAAAGAQPEIQASARSLMEALKTGYADFRNALKP